MSSSIRMAILALFLLTSVCLAGEEGQRSASPDGKFVFEVVAGDSTSDHPWGIARVISPQSGRTIWQLPETNESIFLPTTRCWWSPDSKRFALNFRSGGRYETTDVYQWDGNVFAVLPSLEERCTSQLNEARDKHLREFIKKVSAASPKKGAVDADPYQRRIWDNFTVRRWIDRETVEMTAYSIRSIAGPSADQDGEVIVGSMRFVVRLDKRGRWKILDGRSIPLEQTEE